MHLHLQRFRPLLLFVCNSALIADDLRDLKYKDCVTSGVGDSVYTAMGKFLVVQLLWESLIL